MRKGRSYLWNCCVQEEEGQEGQQEVGQKGLERLHHVSNRFMH